ncbi:MAG: hypothetical protein J6U51_00235 [Bacteroidales bacterium]|nr:hypothetical protein [Bacteroidales bacterium]
MTSIETKRAITYGVLAHINNTKKLTNGQLDIFVPIVKKAMSRMSEGKGLKGENISEIGNTVLELFGVDVPIPVMRKILILISKELNSKEETIFELYNDDGFWIKSFVFSDFDETIQSSEQNVRRIQVLFEKFCRLSKVQQDECDIIRFIEKNIASLSAYFAKTDPSTNQDYSIEAKFVDFFKNTEVYDQIRDLFLGALLSSYLTYQPSELKTNVILLLDTNFIVSMLDLNTPESTKTCKQLLQIGGNLGFKFQVLQDTIEETQGLLYYKADSIDNSAILGIVNREDICNACRRRNLNKTDLQKIADNLTKELVSSYNVTIVPYTEKIKNKAKHSTEFGILKQYRSSEKSALHDAMCIQYVREQRGTKPLSEFAKVNCWWVNNAISHDNESDNISAIIYSQRKGLPEMIKVDDLLCVLWLSSPSIDANTIVETSLTSLVASTLNEKLPKARIIKELDDNIRKYKNENITELDVYYLSIRIANGQIKDLEQINASAEMDKIKFNQRIKEESERQRKEDEVMAKKLDELMHSLSKGILQIREQQQNLKMTYDEKSKEIEADIANKDSLITQKDKEIEKLNQQLSNYREKEKQKYIKKKVCVWRAKTLVPLLLFFLLFLFGGYQIVLWAKGLSLGENQIVVRIFSNPVVANYVNLVVTVIVLLIEVFLIRNLKDKFDKKNVDEFVESIKYPKHLQS